MHPFRSLPFHRLLYNNSILFYKWGVWVASFFNSKAAQFINGRKGVFKQLREDVVVNENYIWIHCSSLGEFEQGRPLIEKLGREFPHYRLVLTFFSPSGYEIRKNYEGVAHVYYLPLDTPQNAEKFIDLLRPQMAIFIKYDFWYHYLKTLQRLQIPTFLVAAAFRKEQRFFKPSGVLFRKMLECFNHIFVQDQPSQALLKQINITEVTVTPDPRIDRVYQMSLHVRHHPVINQFTQNHKVIIGGSTYPEEEDWLYRFFKSSEHHLKLVIAPHQVNSGHLEALKNKFGGQATFYSETTLKTLAPHVRVMIVDQIGFLNELYQYGDLALIGGGFRKSIHNILEPAAFGLPVIFGPNYQKFQEAHHLITKKGAFSVASYEAFKTKTRELLQYHEQKRAGSICKNYIQLNTGGTEQVYEYIVRYLTVPKQNFSTS